MAFSLHVVFFFFEIVKLFYAVQLLRPGLVFQKHHIESLDTCMKY
jgi:hypothetical protein